jgi:hypothetical protein
LLTRRRITIIAIGIIIASVLSLAIGMIFSRGGVTPWGTTVGGDFPAFYVAGQILHDSGPSHLYDRPMQTRRFHELISRDRTRSTLPYAYPPGVAVLMSGLSHLSYRKAAAAWAGISLLLYAGGLGLLWRTFNGIGRGDRLIGILLSLAFEPFIMECIHGGQACAIGFAAVCAALALHRRGRPLAAGLALGLLAYKPTLLLGLTGALLLGRQWRMLGGAAVTIAAGAVLGLATAGIAPTWDFLKLMVMYVQEVSAGNGFFLLKYVDICAFLKLLWHDPGAQTWPAAVVGALIVAVLAGNALRAGRDEAAWITMLLGMLVCNLYVAMYDTVLAAAAMWVMADGANRRAGRLSWDVRWLMVAVFVAPWVTQLTARYAGLQVYTVILGLAALQPALRGIAAAAFGVNRPLSPQLVQQMAQLRENQARHRQLDGVGTTGEREEEFSARDAAAGAAEHGPAADLLPA